MGPRGRRAGAARVGIAAAVVAALAAVSCGDGDRAADDGDSADDPAAVAVLGDSFASGEGTNGTDGDCGRSDTAFAALLAADLDAELHHPACTGARIEDVEAQVRSLGGERVPVAVLSIGGNDAGYASVLADCLGVDDVTRALTGDDDRLDLACDVDGAELMARAEALGPRLVGVYGRVVDEVLTDDGRLVVLTYPPLFEAPDTWPVEEGERCDGISRPDAALLRGAAEVLREEILGAVDAVRGAEAVDLTDVYDGHGRCGPDPWINGLRLRPSLRASFHPADEGHRATADALAALLSR